MILLRRRIAHGLCATAMAAAGVAMTAADARADALLLDDFRELDIGVYAADFGGTNQESPPSTVPSSDGALFNETVLYTNYQSPTGAATVNASATQSSSFNGNTTFANLLANGEALGSAQTDLDAISAQAYALSEFEIDFQLAVPHTFTLSGTLDTFGASSLAEVVLSELGGSALKTFNVDGPFSEPGLLAAGNYKIRARARINESIDDGTVFNRRAEFENLALKLVPVPEPATGLLALCGMLMVVRRTRR